MGKLKPINPTKAQIVANPQATAHDYDNLTHKPQINGHELVGNKSSDDLGLQGKLTAGENITINANGEISATGGTDDYEELTNKPQINGHELSGDQSGSDLGLQNQLTAGDNITIDENGVISAEGGGSEIVSGVVNQNGTITFTDSGGNIFTTTGESVIGPQGIQGAAGPQGPQGEQGVKGDPGATGADGFSPVATVTQTVSGATVTITDKNGTTTANISNGAPGQDYVLTAQDKSDIAAIVLSELPTTQGVQYGNSND